MIYMMKKLRILVILFAVGGVEQGWYQGYRQ